MDKKDIYEMEFKDVKDINIKPEVFTEDMNKEAIRNATLHVDAVLGAKRMTIKEILNIKTDEIIWLKKSIDEPVILMSGNRKIADAETTTINGKLAVKILDI